MGHIQKEVTLAEIYYAREALREITHYPLSPNIAYSFKLIINEINLKGQAIDEAKKNILLSKKTKEEKENEFLKFLSETKDTISFSPISRDLFFTEDKLKISIPSLTAIELFLE